MPRPGRFAANVQQIHPFIQHLFHTVQSPVNGSILSSVRKRIRGHIQDPHHISMSADFIIPVTYSQYQTLFPYLISCHYLLIISKKYCCSCGSSRKHPLAAMVTVLLPGFDTPRIVMHMCSASTITMTP